MTANNMRSNTQESEYPIMPGGLVQEVEVIREHLDGQFSHCVHPSGIEAAMFPEGRDG
jgi:hypothetical protein